MDASLKLNLIVKKFRSTLYSIINSTTRKILLSSFRSGEEGGGGGGGGLEASALTIAPPINVAQVRFPYSASYVG